jgi:hypothetical protein
MLASYSGGPEFKSRPRSLLQRQRVFVIFISHSRKMQEQPLALGHENFLPDPFLFTIKKSTQILGLHNPGKLSKISLTVRCHHRVMRSCINIRKSLDYIMFIK